MSYPSFANPIPLSSQAFGMALQPKWLSTTNLSVVGWLEGRKERRKGIPFGSFKNLGALKHIANCVVYKASQTTQTNPLHERNQASLPHGTQSVWWTLCEMAGSCETVYLPPPLHGVWLWSMMKWVCFKPSFYNVGLHWFLINVWVFTMKGRVASWAPFLPHHSFGSLCLPKLAMLEFEGICWIVGNYTVVGICLTSCVLCPYQWEAGWHNNSQILFKCHVRERLWQWHHPKVMKMNSDL